jgi:hypothetical protein
VAFKTHTRFFQPIAALLLVVSVQACMRWAPMADAKSLAAKPMGTVRLTTDSEPRHVIVKNPTISGDSVVWALPQRGGIPIADVIWVESRSPDRMKTGFFVLSAVGIATLITLLQ